jgi:tRNA C32,U32 (ribose-2'-O)-methylase TrmJ
MKRNLTPNYSRINVSHASQAATYTLRKIYKLRIKERDKIPINEKKN